MEQQSAQRRDDRHGRRRSLEQAMFSIVASRIALEFASAGGRQRGRSRLSATGNSVANAMPTLPMTAAGYAALQNELANRIRMTRPHLAERIQQAIADEPNLIENSEYQAALTEQGHNEARIAELETKLARAEVIDVSKLSGETVKFGATVTLTDQDTGEERICHIVGEPEADAARGKISAAHRSHGR